MTSKRFELGWWVVKRRAPFHPFINLAWRVVLAIVLESALVPSAGFRVSRKRTSKGNRSLGALYRERRCGKSAKPGRLRQHSARPPCNLPSPLRLLGRVRSPELRTRVRWERARSGVRLGGTGGSPVRSGGPPNALAQRACCGEFAERRPAFSGLRTRKECSRRAANCNRRAARSTLAVHPAELKGERS